MTEMDEFLEAVKNLESKQNFAECLRYVKYLTCRIVDGNATGRALDRAIAKHVDKETIVKIYREALRERRNGDEFTTAESSFYDEMVGE